MNGLWWRHNLLFRPTSHLPAAAAYRVASLIGRRDARRQAATHGAIVNAFRMVENALPATACQQQRWANASFGMMARESMDVFRLGQLTAHTAGNVMSLEGLETLDAARTDGRGVIVVMAHFGRLIMPLAGIGLSGRRLGMLTMSVDEDNQAISALERRYLNRKIATLLGHMGGEWISLNDDLRKLHRALAQGASMVMLLDAWMPHFGRHVQLPFLGGRLSVPSGIARIARRTGARLVYCSAHEQGWRILGRLRPLPDTPDDALAQAVHYLESDIRDTPEQWWQWPILERMWSPV